MTAAAGQWNHADRGAVAHCRYWHAPFVFILLLVIISINHIIYGGEAFEHNAGAKFFVFIQCVVVSFPLSIIALVVAFRLSSRIPGLNPGKRAGASTNN